MKDYIEQRCLDIANYMIETESTVRDVATKFGISKTTVHNDITIRLPQINKYLSKKCREVLDYNKSVRHIRGGYATARKAKLLKSVQISVIQQIPFIY